MSNEKRSLEVEREVTATPDEVWEALTTSEGLRRWFPLDARVVAGAAGSVWLSWGPGCEGEAPIHIWEAGKRFGWTESYGNDDEGRPVEVAVDFYIEGREGSTVLRLVQSGLSAEADWDEMYDALHDGWSYFLFNLAFSFEHHRGEPRRLAWKRAPTALPRDEIWNRLTRASLIVDGDTDTGVHIDHPRPTRVVSARKGYHFAATLPDMDQSVFFVELEGKTTGFWLSTYGGDEARTAELQASLDERIREALDS